MEKKYNPSKVEFWAGMFHMFLSLTILSFICHIVGLEWFSSLNVSLKTPPELAQKFINCGLNAIELIFVYKILIREHSLLCSIVAVLQAVFVGFAPSVFQGLINMSCMCLLTVILRKDHVHGLIDFVVLAILMTLYAALLQITKFGTVSSDSANDFYKGIVSVIDYKLFIVTLYMFIKYKGGIKLWKMKRKLFQIDPKI